jgi:hypothetical protein
VPQTQPAAATDSKVLAGIYVFSAGFIGVLLASAYFEREVLLLHLFQSLIYVAVAWLSHRRSKWGYAVGIAIAAEWNAYNLFVSNFFWAGLRQVGLLIHQGRITNPVQLCGALGGVDHFGLMACLIWAYARLPNKRYRDVFIFLGGAILVTAYFFGIIALFWPQFLPRLKAHFFKS